VSREDASLTIDVPVSPRSSREEIQGVVDGRVRIRVNAPPVDGAANKRVIELVAYAFGVPKSRVEVVTGTSSRDIAPVRTASLVG
jgi:uncharacterized protein (TIGR00251 family)